MPLSLKSFQSFLLILTAAALCLASNCRKPEPQKYLGTYPLGDIKDYLYFKPGSMWVYECDSTGELDTQLMVSIDTPWIKQSFIKYQELDRVIKSTNEGSVYSDTRIKGVFTYATSYSYHWYLTRWRSNSKNGGSGTDCIFFKYYDTNSLGGYGASVTKYKGLLTNYTVLGNTYDTVRVFKTKGGTYPFVKIPTTTGGVLTYYWAKNYGLIKLNVLTNKDNGQSFEFNWNLKSQKIIK